MKNFWEKTLDLVISIIALVVSAMIIGWGFLFLYESFKVIFKNLF